VSTGGYAGGAAALGADRRPFGAGRALAADRRLALLGVAVLGAGVVLALGGAASGSDVLALAGGALAGGAVVALVAAGLVPGSILLALAAPLPAVYSSADLRIAAAAPVGAAVAVAWALRRALDGEPLRWAALPRRWLLALVGAVLLATVFADDALLSARETLNFLVLLALLVAMTDELAERPSLAGPVVDALVASAAICGVLAVLEAVGVIPGHFPRWGTPFHRAALGFGQPNGLGLYLVMLIPFAVQRLAAARGWLRVLAGATLAATALGLVATFSRASWLALLAGLAALAFAGRVRLALKAGVLLALAALAVELLSGGMLSDTASRTVGDWIVEQRAALLLAGVRMFLAHPLLGLGPGGFADQVESYAAQVTSLWDYQPTPHDAYVQMAAETGVVGLVAFVGFVCAGLLALRRLARAPAPQGEASLRLALLCSVACLWATSFGIWPFAHGTGEAAILVLALAFSRAAGEPT